MRNRIPIDVAGLMLIACTVFLGMNLSFAGTVDLPKTGQITCYDAGGAVIPCRGTGQDGEIVAGVAWPDPRFTDNGDGTVTDNLTGLMWLKDAGCLGSTSWDDALWKIKHFNANPGSYTCGGYTATYSDWALPNVNELESLANAGESDSAGWLNGQGFLNVQSTGYWSSTWVPFYIDMGWAVFMEGFMETAHLSDDLHVWLVRGITAPPAQLWKTGQAQSRGVAWPDPRFTDNGDGTVTDNLTGLMWLKDANCLGRMSWQDALNKVADLNANPGNYSCGGYTKAYWDWRLPNRKELYSRTDFSRYDEDFHLYFWSSSTVAHTSYFAWQVSMGTGNVSYGHKFLEAVSVQPVRAGQTGWPLVMDIKANGSDGPITVPSSDLVAIDISLDPGIMVGTHAEWWIVVQMPFGMFWSYYSYLYPTGWLSGINRCIELPLINLGSTNVWNGPLPPGEYEFFFVLDDQVDGIPEPKWVDSVKVSVQ